MNEAIGWIAGNLILITNLVTGVIAAASAIAAFTPTPKDDEIVSKVGATIKKVVNFLALNFFHAKNQK